MRLCQGIALVQPTGELWERCWVLHTSRGHRNGRLAYHAPAITARHHGGLGLRWGALVIGRTG